MASGTIKKPGLTKFTAPANADMSSGFFSGTSDGKHVILSLSYMQTSSFDGNKPMFTIPAEYRPSENVAVPGLVFTSSGAPLAASVRIALDGAVTQRGTSSAAAVFAAGVYTL